MRPRVVRVADTWRRLVLAHLAGLGIVPADGGSGGATPGTWWRQAPPLAPYAEHEHNGPGPCPACVGQISDIAAAIPGVEVISDPAAIEALMAGPFGGACPDCDAEPGRICHHWCP